MRQLSAHESKSRARTVTEPDRIPVTPRSWANYTLCTRVRIALTALEQTGALRTSCHAGYRARGRLVSHFGVNAQVLDRDAVYAALAHLPEIVTVL